MIDYPEAVVEAVAKAINEAGSSPKRKARAAIDAYEKAMGFRVQHQIEGDEHAWHWELDKPDGGLSAMRREHPEQTFIVSERLVSAWRQTND